MKKFTTLIAVALLATFTAHAVEDGFFGSGTAGADVVISAARGSISAEDVLINVATNSTCTIRVGSVSVVSAGASTSSNIVIYTSSTNTVRGLTLTTDDYLIVGSQLRDISALSPADANSTTCTVTAATTVAAKQPIHLCDAGDNISVYATTTWANAPLPFLFKGRNGGAAAISVPSTAGSTMVSGKAVRE